ncbi:hypothetical protein [Bradyrhizobium sp. ARR65]|nr:hypothetical protein [Bradyrhizobium sp. ARR65]
MLQNTAYNTTLFDVATLDEAKRIILSPESGRTTDERWAQELIIAPA